MNSTSSIVDTMYMSLVIKCKNGMGELWGLGGGGWGGLNSNSTGTLRFNLSGL